MERWGQPAAVTQDNRSHWKRERPGFEIIIFGQYLIIMMIIDQDDDALHAFSSGNTFLQCVSGLCIFCQELKCLQ